MNEEKTELCIFHRSGSYKKEIKIGESLVVSKKTINILGIKFDENLKWTAHVENAIRESNQVLNAIRIIKKFFTLKERIDLVTSLFYSKLYYGAEIWHLPDLSKNVKKSLKKTSSNALKLCITNYTQYTTYTEIHKKAKRSPPEDVCLYRHALLLHKLINQHMPENEHFYANFQLADNNRSSKIVFNKSMSYDVGSNILLNRFTHLNNKIEKDWMNESFACYKIKVKKLLLSC